MENQVYKGYKIYGPYTRKNGRQHIVAVKDGIKRTVSYPKYLIECYLNRYLTPEETVDHIDQDFRNNNFSNLRVVDRTTHIKEDVYRNKDYKVRCAWCGKEFTIKGSTNNNRNRADRTQSGYFCSRSCSGHYGKYVQETGVRFDKVDRVEVEKYCIKFK